jgi:putative DNA primase/helicase
MSAHWADRYRAAGRVLLPIPAGTKKATDPTWSDPAKRDYAITDGDSIAWRLDGLEDIDLDQRMARLLAARLLPPTPAQSGRASEPEPGHFFYKIPELPEGADPPRYRKFEAAGLGSILEIRTGPTHYTLVPPSVLPESKGKPAGPAKWFADGEPPPTDPAHLHRRAAMLAVAALLATRLGRHGYGHETRLDVAGTLLRAGLTVDEATEIGEAISAPFACDNTETSDVRVSTATTESRLKAGEAARGGPALAAKLGEHGKDDVRRIADWLGRKRREGEAAAIEGIPPLTETGDAEKFAEMHAEATRHDWRRGRWLVWRAPAWRPQTDGEIERMALEAVRARQAEALALSNDDARRAVLKWALAGESRARRSALTDLARSIRPLADAGDNWDTDPWLVAAGDCVVDLRTGEAREGRPEDRVTMLARAEWRGLHEPAPAWEQAVLEIFGGDAELAAYVQRAAGYTLTGDCREECLFVCHGDGANGKGTLMNTLAWALGDYADDLPFQTFEASNRSTIPNDIAKIAGKRMVTSSETGEATRLNEARVKALTGRDPITARFLHQEFFTFQPLAKFWLALNHKPEVHDDSPGFWRRIHLIPFEESFVGREDKGLKDRLRLELPGILAWAARGALEWQRAGLAPPARVRAASAEWRAEADILSPFLQDRCVVAEGARARASAMYVEYEKWRRDHGIKDPLTLRAFGTRMRKMFKAEEGRHVTYVGVGLKAGVDGGGDDGEGM